MPEVVYEKLGEKEDWDEEMYRLVDEKVVDIQYGRWILLGLACGATFIVGISVLKLIDICDDVWPSPDSHDPKLSSPSIVPRSQNTENSPRSIKASSQWEDAAPIDGADSSNDISDTTMASQAFPVVSLAFFLFSTLWCCIKRAIGSYSFRGPTRLLLLLSTIIAVASLIVMNESVQGYPEEGLRSSWVWKSLTDVGLFLEWVTEIATVAFNCVGWWYLSRWEAENSWEMKEKRKQSRMEDVYGWEGDTNFGD